jgi:Uma2 family endonuclease
MAHPALPPEPAPLGQDERIVLTSVPWSHFEIQLALRGDRSSPRIAYLDGAMELMAPSKGHEQTKSYIGRLIEVFALERGLDLTPYGGWTLKESKDLAGAEPDESYIVGADQSKPWPDLVIEVIWSHGGLNKLEIYRRLRIPEVWVWKSGVLSVHVLRGTAYELADHSAVFPDLDLALLASFLDHPSATAAMRAYRDALRA